MSSVIIKEQLEVDPDTVGYLPSSPANDAANLNLLNTFVLTEDVLTVTGEDLLEAMDATEYASLTDAKKAQWLALTNKQSVKTQGNAVEVAKDIWSGKTVTLAALIALRTKSTTPAQKYLKRDARLADLLNARREGRIS